jgi:hypothetical protein
MTRDEIDLVVEAYGFGMERGAYHVLDLIDEGFSGDALRERAFRRIALQRECYRVGLEFCAAGRGRVLAHSMTPRQNRGPAVVRPLIDAL